MATKVPVILLCVLLLMLAACARAPVRFTQDRRLVGRVVDRYTMAPIAGTEVRLYVLGPGGLIDREVVADHQPSASDGSFRFRLPLNSAFGIESADRGETLGGAYVPFREGAAPKSVILKHLRMRPVRL